MPPAGSLTRGLVLAAAVAPYLTRAKFLNLVRCGWGAWHSHPRPRALPCVAIIDVANACNLCCPFCPTGARRPSGRRRTLMELATIEKLLAELGPYLITANLYNWGEPFLHPHLADIVALFHRCRIFTSVSTNLNVAATHRLTAVMDAGLDHLVVSLSGVSPEVYTRYHQGGDFSLVLADLRHLIAYKRRYKLRRPLIELKYLLFTFNRHEVPAFRRLAAGLGVDIARIVPAGGPPEAKIAPGGDTTRSLPPVFRPRCHQLWHAVVLHADGGVAPCCYLYFKADDFGELDRLSLREIRQNDRFVTARTLFHPRLAADLPMELDHPCLKCHLVHAQPHLHRYLQANPHAVRGYRTGGP